MARTVRDVMTPNPLELQKGSTVVEAAMAMKGQDIGAVLVLDGEQLHGIVTDRDIVVRAVAESKDPQSTTLGEIASLELDVLRPDENLDRAVEMIRRDAIRRLPVVDDGGKPVGIVSLGDLAVERDPESALADISAAPPNE